MLASRRTFVTAPSLRLCGGRSIAAPLVRAYSSDAASSPGPAAIAKSPAAASWPKPAETAKSTDTASWPKAPAAAAPASPSSTPYSSRPRTLLKPRPRPAPRLPVFASKGGPIPKAVFRAPPAASATATQTPPAGAVPPASAPAPAPAPAPATANKSPPPPLPRVPIPKLPAPPNAFQRVKYELPGAMRTTPLSAQWVPITPRPQALPAKDTEQDVDWEKSYKGLATNPVTPEQFLVLSRPIESDEIEVKPDGILYMPEIKYRRRLNEVFGPMGWGIVPRSDTVVGKDIVTREYALIVNGCFVSQAMGVNNYFSNENIPQAVEGAKSNALMRCCKDLGIASELWDPIFIRWFTRMYVVSQWAEHGTSKKKRRWSFKKGEPAEVPYPYKLL